MLWMRQNVEVSVYLLELGLDVQVQRHTDPISKKWNNSF